MRPSGVAALLDAIVELVPSPVEHEPFQGTVPTTKTGVMPAKAERASTTDAPTSALSSRRRFIDTRGARRMCACSRES